MKSWFHPKSIRQCRKSHAYIFSMVNLAQTKVSKSLVYDLFEFSKSRSPRKRAHTIAVAIDRAGSSSHLLIYSHPGLSLNRPMASG